MYSRWTYSGFAEKFFAGHWVCACAFAEGLTVLSQDLPQRGSPRPLFVSVRRGLLVLVGVVGRGYWCLVSFPFPPISSSLPEPP